MLDIGSLIFLFRFGFTKFVTFMFPNTFLLRFRWLGSSREHVLLSMEAFRWIVVRQKEKRSLECSLSII